MASERVRAIFDYASDTLRLSLGYYSGTQGLLLGSYSNAFRQILEPIPNWIRSCPVLVPSLTRRIYGLQRTLPDFSGLLCTSYNADENMVDEKER